MKCQANSKLLPIFLLLCIWLLGFPSSTCDAAPVVDVTLEKESAWTGEGVSFFVTLYSPGPFSGTASFDLPELPQTAIVKVGSPVVGNTTVDDESLFTQRHEFVLYTQRSGEVVIPPIVIRFAGKKSFLGEPEPVETETQELRFQSKRPPGSESLGIVVAASNMSVTQSWIPDEQAMVKAGDVVQRTITRAATGTTAMMLPPVSTKSPEGVRVYDTNPTVDDKNARGQSSAKRVDTIKYQFQRPGTFKLPAMEFSWWDSTSSELKTETVEGRTVEVTGNVAEVPTSETAVQTRRSVSAGVVFVVCFMAWLARYLLQHPIAKWQMHRNTAEAIATRAVRKACRENDPAAAYAAVLEWKRVSQQNASARWDVVMSSKIGVEFQREWRQLSQCVFGRQGRDQSWRGSQIQKAFDVVHRRLEQCELGDTAVGSSLPQLNPTSRY